MEDVKRTTTISSNIGRSCEHCDEWIGIPIGGGGDDITGSINHYIDAHGYRLLHVGTQTNHGPDGKPWHNTVAVLGHGNPPAIKPPVEISIGDMSVGRSTLKPGTSDSEGLG